MVVRWRRVATPQPPLPYRSKTEGASPRQKERKRTRNKKDKQHTKISKPTRLADYEKRSASPRQKTRISHTLFKLLAAPPHMMHPPSVLPLAHHCTHEARSNCSSKVVPPPDNVCLRRLADDNLFRAPLALLFKADSGHIQKRALRSYLTALLPPPGPEHNILLSRIGRTSFQKVSVWPLISPL